MVHQNTPVATDTDRMTPKLDCLPVSAAPVFILGMHRSGTTILYEMIHALGGWKSLQAWQVAQFSQLAAGADPSELKRTFADQLTAAGLKTRGVDAIKAGPDTMEEYCFVLDNHGFGNRLTPKSMPMFEQLCGQIQTTEAGNGRLLLKNPWDFGNAHVIQQLIPNARFVFIHRHPQQTINSMYRFLQQALQQPNVWMQMLSRRYRELTESRWKFALAGGFVHRFPTAFVDTLTWWFGRQCNAFLNSVARVPRSARIEITYDQLCDTPNETMSRIHRFLQRGAESDASDRLPVDFRTMISRRAGRSDAAVEARSTRIEQRMQRYLRRMEEVSNAGNSMEQPTGSASVSSARR